jgi:fucose 4-O-acetylase-like acetyltransferase
MKIKRNKNLLIDYYKGVGILLVVIGHAIQFSDPLYINNVLYNIIYKFHMPLFFFISGINSKWLTDGDVFIYILKSRINRILYPFIAWTILFYCLINIFKYHELSTLFEFNFAIYWFLPVLFFISFILLVFNSLFANKYFFCFGLLVLFFFALFFYGGFWMNAVIYNLFFFTLGFVIRDHFQIEISWVYFLLCALIFCFLIFLFTNYNFGTVNLLLLKIVFLFDVLILFKFLFQRFIFHSFFCHLGDASLEIYILHIFVLFNLNSFCDLKSINSSILLIILVSVSYLAVLLIRRFNIFYRVLFKI